MHSYLLRAFTAVLVCSIFVSSVSAATIYLPDKGSTQYLPTVKIFAYSLSKNGDLVPQGYGSGTLIDNKGVVITNNHVVQEMYNPAETYDAFQVCLTRSNEPNEPICEFTASLIARDAKWDVALLRMDPTDVRGRQVSYDFYLEPKATVPDVGTTMTVIGYPDIGGRTITYTSGLVSGYLSQAGIKYIKTDADISFGNSGGTAMDSQGNFIGIPTYIVGSYSSEVLGYIFPIGEAIQWINANRAADIQGNPAARAELRAEIKAYLTANEKGIYHNDYPPYTISLIDGWKFGGTLENSFDPANLFGFGKGFGADGVSILPEDDSNNSPLSIMLSVAEYSYEVSTEDIVAQIMQFYGEETKYELVNFNGTYPAVKIESSYVDWWMLNGETVHNVSYFIPYGSDVLTLVHTHTDADVAAGRLKEIDKILGTFSVDMSKAVVTVVDKVEGKDPLITVKNPLPKELYLSDSSYSYGGREYFSASFAKKRNFTFSVALYLNEQWDARYFGNFDLFKKDTLKNVRQWSNIKAEGDLMIDGHKGFFYTEHYENKFDNVNNYTTNVFVEYGEKSYLAASYYDSGKSFKDHLPQFELILKNVQFENGGKGTYKIPNMLGITVHELRDITHHVYEPAIRALHKKEAFEGTPILFNPEGHATRRDFVMWAVRSLEGEEVQDFAAFKEAYTGCASDCFADVDYAANSAIYLAYAYSKGAIGGRTVNGARHFSPDDPITLTAALKIVFELNAYDIWEPPDYVPWYTPYIYLGYRENVLPYGVEDLGHILRRGEAAYLIDALYADNVPSGY